MSAQVPAEQTVPGAQALLQPPQLALSFWVSTQRPLQKALVAPWQVLAHIPDEHTWLAGHTVPQAPQFAGSAAVSAQ